MASRSVPPRAVVVTRPTDLEMMLLRHGTLAQARFFLESRGQAVQPVLDRHAVQDDAVHKALAAIPMSWRRAKIQRGDLDRFLFEPDDIVIAVGQDGLVANVAKYLHGQPVLGVNPSKALYDGVLTRHAPDKVQKLLEDAANGCACEERTMVQASTPDGQKLVALNEVYVGHRTHQSSRYRIGFQKKEERHSSSGLIVCTGTGSTGWAKSVSMKREGCAPLPAPLSKDLTFLVREPWPSVVTGTDLRDGRYSPGEALILTSEMNDGGVVFGDGIEQDSLELPYGQVLTVQAAPIALRLVP
ncbi:MAG: hypothetical protein Q8O67_01330 [Deltaproteobacteria bacterium]|nr:hypothetical protein [Deltaproteobacteria bacterium]